MVLELSAPNWTAHYTHDGDYLHVALLDAAAVAGAILHVYAVVINEQRQTVGVARIASRTITAPTKPATAIVWMLAVRRHQLPRHLAFALDLSAVATPPERVRLHVDSGRERR